LKPLLVAIVGGSGSGKSWLAGKLKSLLGRQAATLSLDDFYRDRSHLSANRRARLNFDDPQAIEWEIFEKTLRELKAGRPVAIPSYDFKTHCRRNNWTTIRPRSVIVVDGLWLLRRPTVRRLFALKVFLECSSQLRLSRRLRRDLAVRGRTPSSVRTQFLQTVEPMHRRYVAGQRRWADVVLRGEWKETEVKRLGAAISRLAGDLNRKGC
jgi:uridine kinase